MAYRGIVPSYIKRVGNNIDDRDFIDFFRTSTYFFALIVMLARRYDKFRTNLILLQRYLKNKGLYIDEDQSIDQLTYLKENYFRELAKRGTSWIYREEEDYSGELLRLISYNSNDEFIFDYLPANKFGWFVDECSPTYQGINAHVLANKSWENTQDFVDLNLYPLLESDYCTIETEDEKESLYITNVPNTILSGLGSSDATKAIKVDPTVDYEITFWMKVPDKTKTGIYFGIQGFDENDNLIFEEKVSSGDNSSVFFYNKQVIKDDTWYFVRGIIFNTFEQNRTEGYNLEIGFGEHLRFKANCKKIMPILGLIGTTDPSAELFIWDFKVRPLCLGQSISTIYKRVDLDVIEYEPSVDNLVYQGSFSPGFVQIKNFMFIWMKQNNDELTENNIEEIIRRELIPYNSVFKNIYLQDII